jgi:HD superfamily phosphohydrolase
MLFCLKRIFLFFLVYLPLSATNIETFYGVVNVEEPVLLELIESPAFQRLRYIHQYGVAYYTTDHEEFTRYDHSLGVFCLLRANGCSLEEQIAGLLHDVSHTIFSHVGDWIFNRQNQETDYQTLTHADYLERSGLGTILRKYGYEIEQILPKEALFPALEKPLPTLCADRVDYNTQGACYKGFITYEEAMRIFHAMKFSEGEWICSEHELLKKLVRFSIFMSQNCWGSRTEYVLSMWLAEAILRGLETQLLDMEDIRFGRDQEIWDRLSMSDDPLIHKKMEMIFDPYRYHSAASKEEANLYIISKFRGIDPLIMVEGKRVRLTSTDPILAEEFQTAKESMRRGYYIKIRESCQ